VYAFGPGQLDVAGPRLVTDPGASSATSMKPVNVLELLLASMNGMGSATWSRPSVVSGYTLSHRELVTEVRPAPDQGVIYPARLLLPPLAWC
jgi:hypothetical protein